MWVVLALLGVGWPIGPVRSQAAENLPVLMQVQAVRSLAAEEAARSYPVQLEATVTYCDRAWGVLFVQDDTGGIFVFSDEKPWTLSYGQRVAVSGFSDAGGFAPSIARATVKVLGAGQLPDPKVLPLEQLLTGREDSQWIEMEGIIHSVNDALKLVSFGHGHVFMEVEAGGRQFRVWIPGLADQPPPNHLVDSVVRFRGVCGSILNLKKQLIGVQLMVPSLAEIQVVNPAPVDPFSVPLQSIGSLMSFAPGMDYRHRLKVAGVVVYQRPGRDLFVRGEEHAIKVEPTLCCRLQRGQRVEVVGFATLGAGGPVLTDALFRESGAGEPLRPVRVTAAELLDPAGQTSASKASRAHSDGDLVQLTARLLGRGRDASKRVLVLQSEDTIFNAHLDKEDDDGQLDLVPDGSLVDITGVCLLQLGGPLWRPVSFELLLRTPQELLLLQRPPWWTVRRALWVLGGSVAGLLLLVTRVELLRKQVRQRTRQLREEIAARQRMAEEVEKTHQELLIASRQAGQAEVASSILHNVGNVLNSVTVSTGVIGDRLRKLRLANLQSASELLQQRGADLIHFLSSDEKGRRLPQYLAEIGRYLCEERDRLLAEVKGLAEKIDHIKEIVATQQSYAKRYGMIEQAAVTELVDTVLHMHSASFIRHSITIVREYHPVSPVTVDKHKVLQILTNVIRNAQDACDAAGPAEKKILVRIRRAANAVAIEIADNGIGIAPENLTRIFSHGFTTRKNGHGFGLHSAALAAKEMGGTLTADSPGVGRGATFILELPGDPGEPAEPA